MKKILILSVFAILVQTSMSQEVKKIYNPQADAMKDVEEAVEKAKQESKHVFLIIGFNRCPWCHLFHNFIQTDQQIDSLLKTDFVKVMVNYDNENRNMELMKKLEYPNRFGFPVFVVLNSEGKKLHIQNSAYLEEGKGYNQKEVFKFFKQWSPAALDDKNYK